ncbi:hypothetical protein BD770DRAFT_327301 [Pilaira anomala]|nr:hypothetical protein BD770DRAFT_327301 [Pilaira anomala]
MSNGGRRVIVTIDESAVSLEALEWVNSHSILLPDDDVTVALAINEDFSRIAGPGGWQAEGGGGLDAVRNYRETIIEFERRGQRSLDQAVSAIEKTGIKKVNSIILKGHAPEAITKYAKEQKADIVVCGNRGLGYLKRKLIGSTSEYLTHHLDCTVIVVRTRQDK